MEFKFFACIFSECDEHGEKLKLYCNQCKAVCCTFCQIEGDHKDHKIIHIHEAEDLDKRKLCRQQQKVDEYGEKFIKSRSDVQKTIEATKQNDIRLHDVVRRYFRELRMAVDHGEKIILEEVGKRNKATLRALNEQLRYKYGPDKEASLRNLCSQNIFAYGFPHSVLETKSF